MAEFNKIQKIKKMLLVTGAFFIWGCSSASKDIYFRTRLPTMENLDLGIKGKFGVDVSAESKRMVLKVTRNLVSSFQFYKDQDATLQDGRDIDLQGLDAKITYADSIREAFPFILGLSLDHAEVKTGLFDFRSSGIGWRAIANFGYYRTAAYEKDGGCGIICFSSASDRETDKKIEDDIDVDYRGAERKIGTSMGYYFKENQAFYIEYNWFDAPLEATAFKKSTGQKITFKESLLGFGYGLGYMVRTNDLFVGSLSVEHIDMHWDGRIYQTTLLAVQGHISF